MRYFTSHAKMKEDERTLDEDEYSVLYEELNRLGVAYIRATSGWRRREFEVDIVAYDPATTVEKAQEMTRIALETWGITDKVEKFTTKSLDKLCDGNRIFYKRIYDIIPTSEVYSFTTC